MNPNIYIAMVVAVAVVVVVALVLGRKVSISKDDKGIHVETGAAERGQGSKVSVGDGLKIESSNVGNISGVRQEGNASAAEASEVSVAKGAELKGSVVGDITGMSISASPKKT